MAGDLVLLTGATGFLGFRVLVDLLKQGYSVRATVRSQAKIAKVLATPSIVALKPSPSQLSFAIVPDMTVENAYDEATKGVTYIVHVASPIPGFNVAEPLSPEKYEELLVKGPVAADIGMVKSAQKAGTVKRIVLTSSGVATIPFNYLIGQGEDYNTVFEADNRVPNLPGPYQFEFQAYTAGKVAALNAVDAWFKEAKPSFDLITIVCGWIFGRDELSATSKELAAGGTNSVLVQLLLGSKSDSPYNGNVIDVEDAAKVHVLALDPAVKGNQSFNAAAEFQWEDTISAAKKHFPEAFADGSLSSEGKQPTLKLNIPGNKTEEQFGFKFRPFEETAKAVAGQYVASLKAEKA